MFLNIIENKNWCDFKYQIENIINNVSPNIVLTYPSIR
jgi:hypothetical protein